WLRTCEVFGTRHCCRSSTGGAALRCFIGNDLTSILRIAAGAAFTPFARSRLPKRTRLETARNFQPLRHSNFPISRRSRKMPIPLSGSCVRAQSADLGFKRCDALIAFGRSRRDISSIEALGDVLRAIGTPCRNSEQNYLLGPRPIAFRHQLSHQLCVAFDDARRAPNLDALAMRIIDKK